MVINRDYVKVRLQKIECKYRGYYGTDIAEIAEELNVTPSGLKKTNIQMGKGGLLFCRVYISWKAQAINHSR